MSLADFKERAFAIRTFMQAVQDEITTAQRTGARRLSANTPDPRTYDQTQQDAILTQCDRCHQWSYMTHPQQPCLPCRRQ